MTPQSAPLDSKVYTLNLNTSSLKSSISDIKPSFQNTTVAFYPKLGLVLYGSEQAAVKAGLGFKVRIQG